MSMAIIAVAAVAVVAGGAAAYSAHETSKAAKENAKNVPQFSAVNIDKMGGSEVMKQFYDQQAQLPSMDKFSALLNKGYQRQLTSVSPNLLKNVRQLDSNTRSQLQGLLPADVMSNAIRNSGYQSLQGGFGGGSDQGRGLAARNLGLTSLDLMTQGQQSLQNSMAASSALNPSSPINWIFTPQAIQGRQDQNAYYNANLGQQNQMMQYGAQSNANMVAAANNPWAVGIGTAASTFSSMYGGGGGATTGSGYGAGYMGSTGKFGGQYEGNMGGQSVYTPAQGPNTNANGSYNGNNGATFYQGYAK